MKNGNCEYRRIEKEYRKEKIENVEQEKKKETEHDISAWLWNFNGRRTEYRRRRRGGIKGNKR
jgi:hypothetical protein